MAHPVYDVNACIVYYIPTKATSAECIFPSIFFWRNNDDRSQAATYARMNSVRAQTMSDRGNDRNDEYSLSYAILRLIVNSYILWHRIQRSETIPTIITDCLWVENVREFGFLSFKQKYIVNAHRISAGNWYWNASIPFYWICLIVYLLRLSVRASCSIIPGNSHHRISFAELKEIVFMLDRAIFEIMELAKKFDRNYSNYY